MITIVIVIVMEKSLELPQIVKARAPDPWLRPRYLLPQAPSLLFLDAPVSDGAHSRYEPVIRRQERQWTLSGATSPKTSGDLSLSLVYCLRQPSLWKV
jgi:hypothetical protein